MPFAEDCRDQGKPPPAPADSTAQLVQLTSVAEQLEPDAVAVLLLVAQRLRAGRVQYGALDLAHDPRCFRVEALEEAADGLVYAAAALVRGQRT